MAARTATQLRNVPFASRTREEIQNQRITIWHTGEQRKIVGNAAPMAKNLQEYLDKHKGCEVYKGQDNPDQPARANPMEQVLTDEGEYEFYYQARNSTKPLHIPSPNDRAEFPKPPVFKVEQGSATPVEGALPIPVGGAGHSLGSMGMGISAGAGSLTGVPIPHEPVGPAGAEPSQIPNSFNSISGMSWGTPPMDGAFPASSPPVDSLEGFSGAGDVGMGTSLDMAGSLTDGGAMGFGNGAAVLPEGSVMRAVGGPGGRGEQGAAALHGWGRGAGIPSQRSIDAGAFAMGMDPRRSSPTLESTTDDMEL